MTKITGANATGPTSGITRLQFDASGNVSQVTDPNGNVTKWTYNPEDLPTSESLPGGIGTRYYGYDPATGNLTSYTDGNGQTRIYSYSASGMTEKWYPTASDAASGSGLENTVTYQYNSAGQVTFEGGSSGDSIASDTYTYNAAGELASVTEDSTDAPPVTLAYQYNAAGQRTEMAATIGASDTPDFVNDYGYDSAGRVDYVSQEAAGAASGNAVSYQVVTLAYDTAGNLTTVGRYLNGTLVVEADYSYNSYNQLTGLVYYGTSHSEVLASYAWTYDASGLPTLSSSWGASPLPPGEGQGEGASWVPGVSMPVTDTTQIASALDQGGYQALANMTSCTTAADGTVGYSYDAEGQLTQAASSAGTTNYQWDANGNPTGTDPQGTNYAVGAGNELLFDGKNHYQYDPEGNCKLQYVNSTAGDSASQSTGMVTAFVWDARGRLQRPSSTATGRPTAAATPTKSSTIFTTPRTAGSARTSATAAG